MNFTPHELADSRMTLAAEYAAASEDLEAILALKPDAWQAIRERVSSDKAAESSMEWHGSRY
jgi:hypothetical protein